jgi:hypothetical protein
VVKTDDERLGERRRLRAWSGPARGRPVFFWGARCAAWPVVKAPPQKKNDDLLRPLIGLPLRSKGREWGVVDEHGVAV